MDSAKLYQAKTLADFSLNNQPVNAKQAKQLTQQIRYELQLNLLGDERNYAHLTSNILTSNFVSAKEYFGLIIAIAFELTNTDYKYSEGKKLYKEGMYASLCKYPMILIERALKKHCETFTIRPTPCHIIRQIEGYEGVWDTSLQTRKGEIYAIKNSIAMRLEKLERLVG